MGDEAATQREITPRAPQVLMPDAPGGQQTAGAAGAPAAAAAAAAPPGPACTPAQAAYFDRLLRDARRCYAVARKARATGKDPTTEVEIPPAEDLAARVEAQVGPVGVAQRIRDVTREIGNRELVSLQVSGEVAQDLLARGEKREKVLDQAVRTGLSILTEGVLVAPLEGIAEVRIGANMDGTEYVDLYFAGPIRAAGGTGQAMSVLIADVVRRSLGIGKYVPTDSEVERYKEEIPAYKQKANLQYTPTSSEIELIARHCPVCINGEGTEREEVTGNRDLPRVETNQLRGGACLVMAEGLVLKAPKLLKHIEKLKLEGWEFLESFNKKSDAKGDETSGIPDITPITKYVKDIIAGRPVFSHPSRPGGFRLRYGRSRTGGLASTSVHPATMVLLDDFLAVGTQLKVERPGKGTLATPCDTIDGPTVLLRNRDVVRLRDVRHVREVRPAVAEILDLGEILVPFGEFAENNALLPHASWVPEWWEQEVAAAGHEPTTPDDAHKAVEHAEVTGVPLHPEWTLLWHDLDAAALRALSDAAHAHGAWDQTLWLPDVPEAKAALETLLCLHTVADGRIQIDDKLAYPLLRGLGLDVVDGRIVDTPRRRILHDPCQPDFTTRYPAVELASRLSGFPLMPRAPCRIGGRMGRPEKADVRKMKPPSTGLFPLGQAGGIQRLLSDAMDQGVIEVEAGERACIQCNRKTWRTWCDCGGHTEPTTRRPGAQPEPIRMDVRTETRRALATLRMNRLPAGVKGVAQLTSRDRVPEPVEKSILRAKHGVWVFKDGTVRYDMIDIPLTHFRPREIGASVERLHRLGYTHDVDGKPLERDDQMLELRVQDIVVATSCADYLLATARYLDELLESFYGLAPFYNCTSREDLIGHLTIGLAPHTSGGVLCRIVGFAPVKGHFGHPYFHAAKRRNCDGDEDAVMLLLDGLVNFSRKYIPDRRGGLMDLPLVLSTRIDPNEVDKEAHNVDTLSRYPLDFYRATTRHATHKEVGAMMGLVETRLGKPDQYEGFGYTHDTSNLAQGPLASAYTTLETTKEKLTAQMELARKIRAVDEPDVGAKVIGTHLLPDIMGNLKAFSKQKVRCTQCQRKYRRMPLKGACLGCGNPKLTLTVHEGAVRKYLEVCKEIAEKYHIDAYTTQRIRLLEQSVESLFNNDKVRKAKLSDFFGQ